jgi:hypothetical protein
MERTPGSMLEVYMHALSNSTGDALLSRVNLGVGNYTEAQYWQQIEAYRQGLYADSAMTKRILHRAKRETLKRLVDAVFENRDSKLLKGVTYEEPLEAGDVDEDGNEREHDETKAEYLDRCAQDIWENLGNDDHDYSASEHQAYLVNMATDIELDWVPPHWRMLMARHEASRSKQAHLIDNLFGRPPEPKAMAPPEDFQ